MSTIHPGHARENNSFPDRLIVLLTVFMATLRARWDGDEACLELSTDALTRPPDEAPSPADAALV
jgi:hypothetical protein